MGTHSNAACVGDELTKRINIDSFATIRRVEQCLSTAGPRPCTGRCHQSHRAARGSPGICHFSFL